MSKPSEKMTAEEFRKSFCTTNPTAPTSNRVTARQFTGQELVEIRVPFPDGQPGYEIHYVVNSNASERNTPMVFQSKASPSNSMNPATIAPSIDVGKSDGLAVYSIMPQNSGKDYKARRVDVAQPIMDGGPVGGNQGGDYVQYQHAVRRLTPRECERLQGFSDNFTRIPYRGKPASQCPDGPRYKALGNSMAVLVMRWIGEQIQRYEELKV